MRRRIFGLTAFDRRVLRMFYLRNMLTMRVVLYVLTDEGYWIPEVRAPRTIAWFERRGFLAGKWMDAKRPPPERQRMYSITNIGREFASKVLAEELEHGADRYGL
jgi:hypothetical protein